MKKFLAVVLALVMTLSIIPVSALATSVSDEGDYIEGEMEVSEDMASALVSAVFGENIGKAVKTEDGYEFAMPNSVLDAIIDSVGEAAEQEGIRFNDVQSNDAVENPNAVSEDYVDDNSYLEQLLEEIRASASLMDGEGRKKVDLFFIIDSTGSMSSYISGVKNKVAEFAKKIGERDLNLRLGLIDYRDIAADGVSSTVVHEPKYTPWLSVEDFISEVSKIKAGGGGDVPETPLDALGFLTKPDTGWNSDAYKFAILITDVGYKNNNTHGIKDMSEMIGLLNNYGIAVSTITPSSTASYYTDLSAMTGGTQLTLSSSFTDDLMEYADTVIESALKTVRDFTLRVIDAEVGLPIPNVRVSWIGGTTVTNSSGIAKITSNSVPVKSVQVSRAGYITQNLGDLYDEDVDVALAAMEVDEKEIEEKPEKEEPEKEEPEKEKTDDIPRLTPDMFQNPVGGNVTPNPINLEFLGKTFNLIDGVSFDFNLPIFGESPNSATLQGFEGKMGDWKLSINNNKSEKQWEIVFGHQWDKKDDEDPDEMDLAWHSLFQGYKNLVQMFDKSGKSVMEMWGDFLDIRKDLEGTAAKYEGSSLAFPIELTVGGYGTASYASGHWDSIQGGIVLGVSSKELTIFETPLPPAPYIFFKLTYHALFCQGEKRRNVKIFIRTYSL